MSDFWDWIFGRGKHVQRDGSAHSSDRHGFWKALSKLRRHLGDDLEHGGSVDIYDHFGCAPFNDNEVKRQRRHDARPILSIVAISRDDGLREQAQMLLKAFDTADAKMNESRTMTGYHAP